MSNIEYSNGEMSDPKDDSSVKKDIHEEIYQAITSGDVDYLQTLVNLGVDLNNIERYGNTPLHFAAMEDQPEVVEYMVSIGVDVDPATYFSVTPLHYACQKGNERIVRALLKGGASVKSQDSDGLTMFHYVCKGYIGPESGTHSTSDVTEQFHRVIDQLISKEADHINTPCIKGRTPLHYACDSSSNQLVKYLLECRAKVDLEENNGNTALHLACDNGCIPTAKLLIQFKSDIYKCNKYGRTALHIACIKAYRDLAMFLIKPAVRVDQEVGYDRSVRPSVFDLPEEVSSDVNKQCYFGCTPLHYASRGSNTQLVKDLLGSGADVHICDLEGSTALHKASRYGSLSIVKELIDSGADIRKRDKAGCTALHIACDKEHGEIAMLLISLGASVDKDCADSGIGSNVTLVDTESYVNKQCCEGRTALHYACKHRNNLLVKELLKNNASVHLEDNKNATALHTACEHGHLSSVEDLINAGSDILKRDKYNRSPLQIARMNGHSDVSDMLMKQGVRPYEEGEKSPRRFYNFCCRWASR